MRQEKIFSEFEAKKLLVGVIQCLEHGISFGC